MLSAYKINCLSIPSSILPDMLQNTVDVTCITTQDIKNEKISWKRNWYFYTGITIHALIIKKQWDCFMVA